MKDWFSIPFFLLRVRVRRGIMTPSYIRLVMGEGGPVDYSSKQNNGKRGCLSSTLSISTS